MIKKTGFTLVELMIAVAVLAVTSGLTLLTMNNYSNNQAKSSVRNEIVSNLRMARNLAKTMQKPEGFSGNLRYVEVTISSNAVVEAKAYNTTGQSVTYFSRNVGKIGVYVSEVLSGQIMFAPYEGKLLKFEGSNLVPLGNGESRQILVEVDGLTEASVIEIGPLGLVEDSQTVQSGGSSTGRLSATPTSIGTSISPTLTSVPGYPTSLPCNSIGMECRDDPDCCSNYCLMGRCENVFSGDCVPPQTSPYVIESPPVSGNCVWISGCGYNDQFCL